MKEKLYFVRKIFIDFCIFGECKSAKICDFIIDMLAFQKLNFCFFFNVLSMIFGQVLVQHEKHLKFVFHPIVETQNLFQALLWFW